MGERDLGTLHDLRTQREELKRNRPAPGQDGQGAHAHELKTVREDHYNGHHIVIRTTVQDLVTGQATRCPRGRHEQQAMKHSSRQGARERKHRCR